MLEVADVFRLHGQTYLDAYGERMPPRHRDAMQDIKDCRTDAFGGQVYECQACGKKHYSYHSCFNRSCPKCHGSRSDAWLSERQEEILPVPYFHLVFTVPHELHSIIRSHQAEIYGILMKSAAEALLKLGRDPRYVGGELAILAVLHTWSRTLTYHPHVHFLVPGIGITRKQRSVLARKSYLVPVRALSVIFRAIFLEHLYARFPDIVIPLKASRKKWNVFCKPAIQGTDTVLSYLARYVHRVAIANSRIVSISNDYVTFRYLDSSTNQSKTITLKAHEFIRRFLQHVLPKGFHKIRYYGFWASPRRQDLHSLRLLLPIPPATTTEQPEVDPSLLPLPSVDDSMMKCPHCHEPALTLCQVIPRPRRRPP